jgi:Tfp pilus assembly ATPase PilU
MGVGAVLRVITTSIPNFEDLKLPPAEATWV